jgi:hypothetical protein
MGDANVRTVRAPSEAAYSTIVAMDVEGFGDQRRTNPNQLALRHGVYQALESAFDDAGIGWDRCRVEDRGDGVFIVAPAAIPKVKFVRELPDAIARELRDHNASHPLEERIRLRMAVDAGQVDEDAHGVTGVSINRAFRLLDSAQLRMALASSPGVLGLIISSWFFNEVVLREHTSRPGTYQRVRVSVKETDTEAWVCLPDAPDSVALIGMEEPTTYFISYASADRNWAEWVAWQLRDFGYHTLLGDLGLVVGRNFADHMMDAFTRADVVVTLLSPEFIRAAQVMSESSAPVVGPGRPVISVRVQPTIDARTSVDLVGVDEETGRQRLLAAVGERGELRIAPPYPGRTDPAVAPIPAAFPGPTRTEDSRLALVVHARRDLVFAEDLSESLRVLESEGVVSLIELRSVSQLDQDTEKYVDSRIRRARVVLVVVTRDLLATSYGRSWELRQLLRFHEERRLTLLPVIVRPTAWERTPFGHLAALPTDGIPVSQWQSKDEALKNIVDGVRLSMRGWKTDPEQPAEDLPVSELGAVFKPAGVPTLTFVEPDDFIEFKMALRQPGLGVVLEGPSGIGKTTLLRHAVKQDADQLGEVPVLSARRPLDLEKIKQLPNGHTGLVAVDDFQRLSRELQDQLADYLKLLADDDSAQGKLTIVGIPGTAQSLVELSPDVATRIRVFKLGRVAETLLMQMMDKGEAALNITFDSKAEIAMASAGSLLTAQMLCWHLAMMAGIERTVDRRAVVRTDIGRARTKVTDTLHLKYQRMIDEFIAMDGPTEMLCIELLLGLAKAADGILRLGPLAEEQPTLSEAIDRVFVHGTPNGLGDNHNLFYDQRGHRLIADDPQFVFYLRQLTRDGLLDIAGKQLPVPRDQIFVCYSHRDAAWLERVQVHLRPLDREGAIDLWSDRRIEAGDMWRKEIAAALARARIAVLLISADFFASDFIHSEELPALLAAAEKGGCRVIPVLVAPSMFKDVPKLACFSSVPGGTTLSELPTERSERVLADLARSVGGM